MNDGALSRPIVPPVFVWGDGTLNGFDSPESAARYYEPVDVSAGLCAVAFDAHGQTLELYVVEEELKQRLFFWTWTMKLEKTRIRLAAEQTPDVETYRQILAEYLEPLVQGQDLAQRTFAQLVEVAFPLIRAE